MSRKITDDDLKAFWKNSNYFEQDTEPQPWENLNKYGLTQHYWDIVKKCSLQRDGEQILHASFHPNDTALAKFNEVKGDLIAWVNQSEYLERKFNYHLLMHPLYGLLFAKYFNRCKKALGVWTDPDPTHRNPFDKKSHSRDSSPKRKKPSAGIDKVYLLKGVAKCQKPTYFDDFDFSDLSELECAALTPYFKAISNLDLPVGFDTPTRLLAQLVVLMSYKRIDPSDIARRDGSVVIRIGTKLIVIDAWFTVLDASAIFRGSIMEGSRQDKVSAWIDTLEKELAKF